MSSFDCCKNCKRRVLHCHDKCEEYRAAKEKDQKAKAWLKEMNDFKMSDKAFDKALPRKKNKKKWCTNRHYW